MSEDRSKDILQTMHSDLCSLVYKVSFGGSRHLAIFTDKYSRYGTEYFLKLKGELFRAFKDFIVEKKRIRR